MSVENNGLNPLLNKVRFCRRIVPDGNPIADENWEMKFQEANRGGGRGDYLLRKPQTQVPKGFMVIETVQPGEEMEMERTKYADRKKEKAVHVCTKEGGWDGDVNGMLFKWVPID